MTSPCNRKETAVKQTTHIDAASIQRLRLRCQHCRVEIVLPLDIKQVPGKCFNCHHELPGEDTLELIKKLRWLQEAAKDRNFNFDAAIEADSEAPDR